MAHFRTTAEAERPVPAAKTTNPLQAGRRGYPGMVRPWFDPSHLRRAITFQAAHMSFIGLQAQLDQADSSNDRAANAERLLREAASATGPVDQIESLRPVVANLPARDRLIFQRRFLEHRTQAEIGHELGVTQMQVSRLLNRIMLQLRLALSA
jgi:RNA polymerase sigma factor (sigma-70 family)